MATASGTIIQLLILITVYFSLGNNWCGKYCLLTLSKHTTNCVGSLELPSGGRLTLILLQDQGAME